MESFISVIICTYNRADLLRSALESLAKQTVSQDSYEVIVVNNNCTDNTTEVAREFMDRYMNWRMVYEVNQGLSHARNRGYKEAKGAYVAYLDDDAKASPNWVEEMIRFIQRRPDIVVFGGPYYEFSLKTIPKWLPPKIETHTLGDVEHKLATNEWVSGSNIVFTKSILEKYGGFNTDLGMKGGSIGYGEETELLVKFKEDMIDIYYVPTMYVEHLINNQKFSLLWHLKSFYADGKSCVAVFKMKIRLFKLFVSLWTSIRMSPIIFFRQESMPFKRRIYYSVGPIFANIGSIVGTILAKSTHSVIHTSDTIIRAGVDNK
jgi:glycosyltransferase involved in cell wall biosynthesis